MQSPSSVFSKVLPRIKPSKREQERDLETAKKILSRVRSKVPRHISVALMGSVAKGTNLLGNRDFDVFLLFPKSYTHHEMATLGLHYAKSAADKYELAYAEHPYLRAWISGQRVDIVPSFKIERIEERASSVDRSQLHTAYVNARMGGPQRDEVRLLKKFMQTLGVYGAELKVEGFSGYLCELLILHYGSLEKLMHAASSWHRPTLDLANTGNPDIGKLYDSPMVVIDPVDPKRNVAAVVSATSLYRFVLSCRQFLANPSEKFFFKEREVHSKKRLSSLISARNTSPIAVLFPAPHLVEDILWPQLKKTTLSLVNQLSQNDFEVFGYYYWSDGLECAILLELQCESLPSVRKLYGPAVWMRKATEDFLRAHKSAYNLHIEHERITAMEKRQFSSAHSLISHFAKNGTKLGVPGNFAHNFSKLKILPASRLLDKRHIEMLSDYFTRSVI